MSLRSKFFALTYDRQMAKTEQAGLHAFRERLLAGLTGDVLEIGGGTGANLPCYGPAVTSLTLTEPQPPMLRRLERAVREHRPLHAVHRDELREDRGGALGNRHWWRRRRRCRGRLGDGRALAHRRRPRRRLCEQAVQMAHQCRPRRRAAAE